MRFVNIFNAALLQGSAILMFRKLLLRVFDKKSTISENQNLIWLKENTSSIEEFCKDINKELWNEVQDRTLTVLAGDKLLQTLASQKHN